MGETVIVRSKGGRRARIDARLRAALGRAAALAPLSDP